jgi:hypothetical protein
MRKRIVTVGLILALGGLTALGQATMSNADVVKLTKAGLSEDFILNVIDQQGSRLSSDVSGLVDLKQNDVSERIIGAVVRKSPSSEPLNSDSILRLSQAGFSDNFILDLMDRQPVKFSARAERIVELKQAGVSERILSRMVVDGGSREIPSGTLVSVRLIEGLDSERNNPGDEVRASLEDPITLGDDVVVPKGADARVRLATEKSSGKLTGKAELTVELVSITVNGRTVPVSTSSVAEYSGSQTGSTVKKAAVVGAIGAVIGAIAGGGKGAAIGAGSGAAVGAGSGVFMKGQRVKIPSETLLTFTTEQAIKL